jgi:hypothetical protein
MFRRVGMVAHAAGCGRVSVMMATTAVAQIHCVEAFVVPDCGRGCRQGLEGKSNAEP